MPRRIALRRGAQLHRALAQRRDEIGIGGRRRDVERVDRHIEQQRRILDQRELGRLILRHEAVERDDVRHLRQLREPRGQRRCVGAVGGKHVDRVGRAVGIAGQLGQRAHRGGMGIAQVERVEIEHHPRQQRDARGQRRHERPQHRAAPSLQQTIDRREPRKARLAARRARPEHDHQRGEQGHAQRQRDTHAQPGDHARLGDADIFGRQERAEAEEDRPRRQRQWRAEHGGGLAQRRIGRRAARALGIVADADLDAEIHAQSDEQRDERDRDQVEPPHREQPDRHGDDEAEQDGGEDRRDQPRRARRQPERYQHRPKHDRADEADILLQGGEFLVGERHFAGELHADAMRGV